MGLPLARRALINETIGLASIGREYKEQNNRSFIVPEECVT